MYNYSVFAATSVGEGPSADGSFLTREDSELIINCTKSISISYAIQSLCHRPMVLYKNVVYFVRASK